jgi:hypothetical protein
MLLRRLAQSLKTQNWTAIWIEFVLLVVGVFLGIQVSNWNAELETERKARVFTERLRNDLRVEVWRYKALNLYYDDVIDNGLLTLDDLEGRKRLSNEALLIAAYRATQYSEFIQYRGTYDELTSTGNLGLVRDRKLQRMAAEIYGTSLYLNAKNEGTNSEYRRAFRMLIPVPVQITVTQKCGDLEARVLDYRSIEHPLFYACKTGLTASQIDQAAAALRAQPGLPALLRLRLVNVGTVVGVQLMSREVIAGMNEIVPGALELDGGGR